MSAAERVARGAAPPSRADWQAMAREHGWKVRDSVVDSRCWWADRGRDSVEIQHDTAGGVLSATVDDADGKVTRLGAGVPGALLGDLAVTLRTAVPA